MHPKLKRLMTHKATVRKLGRNMEGDWTTLATYTNVPCFFQWGNKVVRDKKGEEVTASAVVFMYPDAPIDDSGKDIYWEVEQTQPYSRVKSTMIRIDPIDDPRTGKTHHREVAIE